VAITTYEGRVRGCGCGDQVVVVRITRPLRGRRVRIGQVLRDSAAEQFDYEAA
jgi:hypothetical protein